MTELVKLQAEVRRATIELTEVESRTFARRAELEAIVTPFERLPIAERVAALAAAGLTVEQFRDAVMELDGWSGAVSALKTRVRRLEAELADLAILGNQHPGMDPLFRK